MKLYSTVAGPGEGEQIIERSRFITHVMPCGGREAAETFFEEIRKKYRDATHNVPAMVIGDAMQVQWGSDDGEPQGTSGAPIVQLLVSLGVTDTAVMVTRYFGGIKLGTGGLVRAYTSSAKIGLEAAGICDVEQRDVRVCKIDYKAFHRVQNHDFGENVTLSDFEYLDRVGFHLTCDPSATESCIDVLTGIAGGGNVVEHVEGALVKVPRSW